MKYVGSKNKLCKHIVPILQKCIDENHIDLYYEPFVGGANIIDKIKCQKRIGNDSHPYLIAMFKALQNGWIPPYHISEDEYYNCRNHPERYKDYEIGLIGFCGSYGAKWWGGYARGNDSNGNPRDIPNESIRNILKQFPNISDVEFSCGDYTDNCHGITNAVIYCDPPYKNSTGYSGVDSFDYDKFYSWCREMAKHNHVFVTIPFLYNKLTFFIYL